MDQEKNKLTELLAKFLKQLTLQNQISSVNVNFMKEDEPHEFIKNKYALRETIQYRWNNRNNDTLQMFTSFDDYLSSFKSKRRIKIKGERKKVYEAQSLRLEVIRGDDPKATPEFYSTMFDLYRTTVEKMWGMQYLTREFFQMLYDANDFKKYLLFIVAYNENDRLVAGTINSVSKSHFYGRYWGAFGK